VSGLGGVARAGVEIMAAPASTPTAATAAMATRMRVRCIATPLRLRLEREFGAPIVGVLVVHVVRRVHRNPGAGDHPAGTDGQVELNPAARARGPPADAEGTSVQHSTTGAA
jgi:hypothetical protein